MKCRRVDILIAAGAVIALMASLSLKAENPWHQVGPPAAEVLSLGRHPTHAEILFSGTIEGLFKSIDGGRNWVQLPHAPRQQTELIRVDPNRPSRIFVGTFQLYRSTDSGYSWRQIGRDSSVSRPSDLYIHPDDSDRILVGGNFLFLSQDGGDSFDVVPLPAGSTQISTIAADPDDPNNVFVAQAPCPEEAICGLHKSTDAGATFELLTQEFPLIQDMLVSALDSQIVLLANTSTCFGSETECGVFRSTNGGQTWTEANQKLRGIQVLVQDSQAASTVYALGEQVYRSSNQGLDWEMLTTGFESSEFPDLLSIPGALILANESQGILRSGDAGQTWQLSNHGMQDHRIIALAVDPQDEERLFASTLKGLWRSSDGGVSWQFIDERFLNCLAFHPMDANVAYACSIGISQVLKTTDGGEEWLRRTFGAVREVGGYAEQIIVDPSDPDRLFLAMSQSGADPGGVFLSTNGADDWSLRDEGIQGGSTYSLAMHPSDPDRLFAGAQSGFYRTTDGGESWHPRHSDLPDDPAVTLLKLDPHDPVTIYASVVGQDFITSYGLFKTRDEGESWEQVFIEGESARRVFPDPHQAGTLFGYSSEGFWRSRDDGVSWISFDDPTFRGGFDDVAFSRIPNRMYAASRKGVWATPSAEWAYQPGNRSGSRFDGLALTNYTTQNADIDVTEIVAASASPASSSDSRKLRTGLAIDLPAGRQSAQLRQTLFPDHTGEPGWLRLVSDTPVASFFQFGTQSLNALDGGVAIADVSRLLVLPRILHGETAFRNRRAITRIGVLNPSAFSVEFDLTFRQADGSGEISAQRDLEPGEAIEFTAAELWGSQPLDGYGLLTTQIGSGVVSFLVVELPDQDTLLGFNSWSFQSEPYLYSAQLASSPDLFTEVNLINPGPETRQATLRLVGSDGEELTPSIELNLEPGEQVLREAVSLVQSGIGPENADLATVEASLVVEVDGDGVLGTVIFGDSRGLRFAAALPLQTVASAEALYSQVANLSGFFTGLAFFSPSQLNFTFNTITVEVYGPDGSLTGTDIVALAPGSRTASLLPELVAESAGQTGGYIRLLSSDPVISQMLLGAVDARGIRQFSAVPPAIVR